jgi:hypothetical protein
MKTVLIIFLLPISALFAQDLSTEEKKGFKYNNLFDLDISVGSKQYTFALDWNHMHGIGKKKRLKIGYGIRWSNYFGSGSKSYQTAPAKLTSGQQGPQVLFSNYINNIDTVQFSNPYIGMVNAFVSIQYTIFKKVDLGFNIDVVGLSYGSKSTGEYHPNSSALPSTFGLSQSASPSTFNLLLVSDNDLGGLNSEFYLRYWFNDKLAIKGMFTFIFTEYTTANKLRLENDKFRNKGVLFGLGVTYNPWN